MDNYIFAQGLGSCKVTVCLEQKKEVYFSRKDQIQFYSLSPSLTVSDSLGGQSTIRTKTRRLDYREFILREVESRLFVTGNTIPVENGPIKSYRGVWDLSNADESLDFKEDRSELGLKSSASDISVYSAFSVQSKETVKLPETKDGDVTGRRNPLKVLARAIRSGFRKVLGPLSCIRRKVRRGEVSDLPSGPAEFGDKNTSA